MAPSAPSIPQQIRDQLEGKVFVFTGRLASLSRREATALVRIRGGSARRHVSRHTSFLVIGDADRSRPRRQRSPLADVERLGSVGQKIRVISESEFLKLLGSTIEP